MQSYDPSSGLDFINEIPETSETEKRSGPPTGLLPNPPPEELKKNLGSSQMAEFSTAIEEVMPGPGQMMQDEMMGPSMPVSGNRKTARKSESKGASKNPFGLTDEQYYAVLAGVAAVVAFSKPVQGKLSSMVPKFTGDGGDLSLTGMIVSALVAAVVFYFARQFLVDR
jgi:hypothetical protein